MLEAGSSSLSVLGALLRQTRYVSSAEIDLTWLIILNGLSEVVIRFEQGMFLPYLDTIS